MPQIDDESLTEEEKTYWVLEPHQLRCMASARRHDIIDRLVASGPLSIKDLAHQIGAEPSALYHHVRQLVEVGLVISAGHRVRNRKREELYTTKAPRVRLSRALERAENRPEMVRVVSAMCRQMDRDFKSGVYSETAVTVGEQRNLGFFRMIATPSKETLAEINKRLADLGEIFWSKASGDGDPMALAWVMTPASKTKASKEDKA